MPMSFSAQNVTQKKTKGQIKRVFLSLPSSSIPMSLRCRVAHIIITRKSLVPEPLLLLLSQLLAEISWGVLCTVFMSSQRDGHYNGFAIAPTTTGKVERREWIELLLIYKGFFSTKRGETERKRTL